MAQDDDGTALADYRLAGDGTATFAGCLGTRSQCTPTLGFDQPSDLAVSPDGRDVYVAAEYRVVDFRRAADGSLSAAGCAGGPDCAGANAYLDEPHAIAVTPSGSDVYVTDGEQTVMRAGKVVHFTRAGDGSLSYADCAGADIPAYDAPCAPLPPGVAGTAGPLGLPVSRGCPPGRSRCAIRARWRSTPRGPTCTRRRSWTARSRTSRSAPTGRWRSRAASAPLRRRPARTRRSARWTSSG